MRPAAVGAALFNAVCYLFLALPAIVVVAASFSSGSLLTFPPRGFTLAWYGRTFADAAFMASLKNSVELAIISTALALALGLPAGYALARYRFRGRELAQSVLMAPLVVPAVVFAIGLLQLLSIVGLARTMAALVVGHVVVTLPYVVRNMTAAFVLFDPSLEQAARNLRATPWQVIRRVTLPVMLPSVLSSAV
ncbi:MAG: ABC transporter permease, partial [Alphaproteobacteria bacterium]